MSDDIARRLAALRQHFENFTISGDGIQVQGSIKEGFVISPGPGGGGVRGGLEVLPDYEIPPPDCECIVDNLEDTYYVTIDRFLPLVVAVQSELTGASCSDWQWNGQDEDEILIVGMNNLGPEYPGQWQLTVEPDIVLYKIEGSGPPPDCDIASPIGSYEGDGETGTVSLTP